MNPAPLVAVKHGKRFSALRLRSRRRLLAGPTEVGSRKNPREKPHSASLAGFLKGLDSDLGPQRSSDFLVRIQTRIIECGTDASRVRFSPLFQKLKHDFIERDSIAPGEFANPLLEI